MLQVARASLEAAAAAGDVDTCERLLGQGLSVDSVGQTGRTLLCTAVAAGQVDVVRLLLHKGASARSW